MFTEITYQHTADYDPELLRDFIQSRLGSSDAFSILVLTKIFTFSITYNTKYYNVACSNQLQQKKY